MSFSLGDCAEEGSKYDGGDSDTIGVDWEAIFFEGSRYDSATVGVDLEPIVFYDGINVYFVAQKNKARFAARN